MYFGRLYFRKDTGALLYYFENREGDIAPTVEQDLLALKPLSDYNRESIEIIELTEKDYETRDKARRASNITMDPATKALSFTFAPETVAELTWQEQVNAKIAEHEQLIADLASLTLGV